MAGIPPLRNLRKTTVLVLVVFLAFLVHRFIDVWMEDRSVQDVADTELSPAMSVVCRNVVRGTPFGVDSVFDETSRLYFYSTITNARQFSGDTLKHIWFHGTDTIQILTCNILVSEMASTDIGVCHTEISPTLLEAGEWSVDLVAGRKLLSSQQFSIESSDR